MGNPYARTSSTFQQHSKIYPPHFQFQFNSGTLENVHVPSSKPDINFYTCRLTEPTFGAKTTTSEKFQFHIQVETIEKTSFITSFSVST